MFCARVVPVDSKQINVGGLFSTYMYPQCACFTTIGCSGSFVPRCIVRIGFSTYLGKRK